MKLYLLILLISVFTYSQGTIVGTWEGTEETFSATNECQPVFCNFLWTFNADLTFIFEDFSSDIPECDTGGGIEGTYEYDSRSTYLNLFVPAFNASFCVDAEVEGSQFVYSSYDLLGETVCQGEWTPDPYCDSTTEVDVFVGNCIRGDCLNNENSLSSDASHCFPVPLFTFFCLLCFLINYM